MNYDEAIEYIHKIGNFGSNYGLERTCKILELLGSPEKDLKLVHIAGTNGKGSTTSILTSLLMEGGFKVGMYTSPFLEEFEERIQINRNNIPKEKLARLITKIEPVVNKVIDLGYNHPTEFEIITCLMFLYFKEEEVDYGVIEVGLGGRLDSTNVITPVLSVIASISLDHTNLLGNTIEEITKEKAGIIKENIPLVSYPQKIEAMNIIKEVAKEKNSPLYIVDEKFSSFVEVINEERIYQRVEVEGKEYKFSLLGEHQINNLAVALKAFRILCEDHNISLSEDKINNALASVVWKGRLEVMKNEPLVVIDGAHNIDGIKSLYNNVHKYFTYRNIYLIIGILGDKQVEEMVDVICKEPKKIFALEPKNIRATSSEGLREIISKVNTNVVPLESYEEAIDCALKEASEEDLILVCGSLYMIGDMRKIINQKVG